MQGVLSNQGSFFRFKNTTLNLAKLPKHHPNQREHQSLYKIKGGVLLVYFENQPK